MLSRNYIANAIHLHPWVLKLKISLCKPFSFIESVKHYVRYKEYQYGFFKVLKPGDTAVQAGVAMRIRKPSNKWYDHSSHLWRIAKKVGKSGRVIVIEPDPRNIEKMRAVVEECGFNCEFIVVQKALFKKKGATKFHFGHRTSNNQIDNVQESDKMLLSEEVYTGESIDVEQDNLDNILKDLGVAPESVDYINLTINGAEYDALLGMPELLRASENLSITTIAGRDIIYQGKDNMGFIDGRPDHEVISDYLSEYGFNSSLKRFWPHGYGYVVSTKGDKPVFM